jgi:hypothetical protein
MREPRRLRRYVAGDGTEFDESIDGLLRRRLLRSDKSRIPTPQRRADVAAEYGELREMSPVEATITRGWARR